MIALCAWLGCVAQLALIVPHAAAAPPAEALRDASDAELKAQYTEAASRAGRLEADAVATRDRILLEIARRGGNQWEGFLTEELKRPPVNQFEIGDKKPEGVPLELLTGLRRLQRRPDPVHITLSVDKTKPLTYQFPALPQLPVALTNQDADQRPVLFTEGGDYRTGRQARWRFEVRNAAGEVMPVREYVGDFGGGLYNVSDLKFGEAWRTDLDMASFIPALPPGRYRFTVLYHDSLCISEMSDADAVAALVTCKSEEMSLVVAPRTVTLSNAEDREVRDLLNQIDVAGPVKIVAGTYGPWAEKFVPPDSAHGRLLRFELRAVPPILRALEDEKLAPKRRAMILGLLFSLTGQNDPRDEDGVVGASRSEEGPWAVWGERGGGMMLGGSAHRGGYIDVGEQLAFAKRWQPWKDYVRVARPLGDVD
jgi:hypothetical protein